MENSEKQTNETLVNIAVGQKISQILYLKFGKNGKCKTDLGIKSIQGLGSMIVQIVEQEKERINS